MTAPIHDQLAAETGITIDHHMRHTETGPVGPPAKGTTMDTKLRQDLTEGITYLRNMADRIAGSGIVERLDQLEQSKIVQAAEAAALGPAGEAAVVAVINALAAGGPITQPAPAATVTEPEPEPEPAQ